MFPRTVEVEQDQRMRETTTMLGPLAAVILHKPGAHYGYLAGRQAYADLSRESELTSSLTFQQLRLILDAYLALPRHRPRRFSRDVIPEWRAMFILGWTEALFTETRILKE
ncbi:MAG TPA: hypothetical protein VKR06_23885 [Ktedonosporobacter sp.]|nr:hypothetical protein [Ktedonosporobacter sp.]